MTRPTMLAQLSRSLQRAYVRLPNPIAGSSSTPASRIEFFRQSKHNRFRLPAHFQRGRRAPTPQFGDDLLHQDLRRRRASGAADRLLAVQPVALDIIGAIDHM